MSFDPITAAIRFGCGLSPRFVPPADIGTLYTQAVGPDDAAQAFPITSFEAYLPRMAEYRAMVKARRDARGTDAFKQLQKDANVYRATNRKERATWLHQHILRRSRADQGFRERLVGFWADHFTAIGKGGISNFATSPYVETAIRPHVAGNFGDMLVATTTAPLMLIYLDQDSSIGPNSERGTLLRKRGKEAGLNENLAREVLELHTLGVGGPYTQDDVRQLAELFTGMTVQPPGGFNYRKPLAEPGAEVILGKSYGGGEEIFANVERALRDLAVHPATAAHIARKLAVHFVSDTPEEALVSHIEARFNDTGGDLAQVTAALLEHPGAWRTERPNVKQPFDFVTSALRALDVGPGVFKEMREKQTVAVFYTPLAQMGQIWEKPSGPDGFAEQDGAWITPQGLAARLQWAVQAPQILTEALPDPRAFVDIALASRATEAVRFAAGAAESRHEGVGLILASPAFQRL